MRRLSNPLFILFLLLPFLIGGLPGASLAQQAAKPKSTSLRITSKSKKIVLASGEKRHTYRFLSASSPLTIAVTGPVLLKANVRLNFDMKNLTAKKTGELTVYRDQKKYSAHKLEWKPSQKLSYPESSGLLPSVSNIVKIEIPSGGHKVKFALSSELSAAVRLAKAPLVKSVKSQPAAKKKKVETPAKPEEVKKSLVKPTEVKKPKAEPKEVKTKPEEEKKPVTKPKEGKKPVVKSKEEKKPKTEPKEVKTKPEEGKKPVVKSKEEKKPETEPKEVKTKPEEGKKPVVKPEEVKKSITEPKKEEKTKPEEVKKPLAEPEDIKK